MEMKVFATKKDQIKKIIGVGFETLENEARLSENFEKIIES